MNIRSVFIVLIITFSPHIWSTEFAIVIDGGTSSSKFSVFSYDDIRRINQELYFKVYPGAWNFADNLVEITNQYIPAIDDCLQVIPPEKVSTTPIYLGGTSGMRALERSKRNGLIDHIRSLIKENYPNLRFKDRFIRVLSGSEEAIYGWIAVQLLLENDFSLSKINGMLDMGSGSNQIVFQPDEDILDAKSYVNVVGGIVSLYGNSFQTYGQDSGLVLSKQILVEKFPNYTVIEHPCYLQDYSEYDPDFGVNFTGTSNPEACKNLVRETFNFTNYCPYELCSLTSKYIPQIPKDKHFIAMSGYWYMCEGVYMHEKQPRKLSEIIRAAEELCSLDFASAALRSFMYTDAPENFPTQCYYAFHDLLLLVEQHHFDIDSAQITFITRINGKKVSWAPGLLFFEVETMTYLPTLFPSASTNLVIFQSLSILFGSLFGIAMIVIVVLAGILLFQLFRAFDKKGLSKDGKKDLINQVVSGSGLKTVEEKPKDQSNKDKNEKVTEKKENADSIEKDSGDESITIENKNEESQEKLTEQVEIEEEKEGKSTSSESNGESEYETDATDDGED